MFFTIKIKARFSNRDSQSSSLVYLITESVDDNRAKQILFTYTEKQTVDELMRKYMHEIHLQVEESQERCKIKFKKNVKVKLN
jgi:hypothetical protein